MGDEAQIRGLKPSDQSEWFPFVEGYAELGRYSDARDLIAHALGSNPAVHATLSDLCRRLAAGKSDDVARVAFIAELYSQVANLAPSRTPSD